MILNRGTIRELNSKAVLATDSLREIQNIINIYPVATQEDNLELVRQYREGNQEALELLIKVNMRLILKVAKSYQQKASFYQLEDTIQEVIIALMNAANIYDIVEPEAHFSTYFINQTIYHVNREYTNNDSLVRRPNHIKSKMKKYNKLMFQSEIAGKELTDEEAKAELNLTDGNLEAIKNDYKLNATSINAKVDSNDDSSTELSEFISDGSDIDSDIVTGIYDQELFVYLKQTLTPLQFYILVETIYKKTTLRDLGKELGLTGERVRQHQAKALKILKMRNPESHEFNYKLNHTADTKYLRGAPTSPSSIANYMFFKDYLTDKERELYKLYIKGEYITKDYVFARQLNLTLDEYQKVKESLSNKIRSISKETAYELKVFREMITKNFGIKIYNINWDMDTSEFRDDLSYIFKIWSNKTYEEVMATLNRLNIEVDEDFITLLKQFFNYEAITQEEIEKAEFNINKILFTPKKQNDIPHDKLLRTLKKYPEEFSEEQYDFLMMHLANRMSKKAFIKKYPYSPLVNPRGGAYVLQRLERLYYNIANYKSPNFSEKIFYEAIENNEEYLTEEEREYLNLYYGYDCEKHSVFEIQEIFRVSYEEARTKLINAKRKVQSIYLERTQRKMIELSYYQTYILDEKSDLNDLHRKLLKGYYIDKLSYEELAVENGMSKHDVSSNILDGILKIDFCRFGILHNYEYPKAVIKKALKSPKLSDEEKVILKDLQNGMTRTEVAEKYGKKLQTLDTLITKFNGICHSLVVDKRKISEDDIRKELNIHKAANVLNENERKVLAYTYGIKCDINEEGLKIPKEEFRDYFPSLSSKYSKLLKSGLDTIKGKKAKIDRATLDIIDRKELRRLVLDPHLPITEKELELLSYTYELRGYEYKDLNELAKLYNERATSIKRRIQRAVVTIKKYQQGEIKGNISYEYDILNNFKFFTKNDREILTAKYKDNLSIEEIAKKFNLTYSQVEKILRRLEVYLKDILSENINPFDFDYYYENVDKEDFPYHDNIKLAKEIFNLYFEERLTVSEIKEKLGLEESITTIQRTIQALIIATEKSKEGIKKTNNYTYDDVASYYKKHAKKMNPAQLRTYRKYFKRIDKALNSGNNENRIRNLGITPRIVIDLKIQAIIDATKRTGRGIKKVLKYSYEEIVDFYRKNSQNMDREQLSIFQNYFDRVDKKLDSTNDPNIIKNVTISPNIILDLTIANSPNSFSFETSNKEQAFDIITKHKKELEDETIITLAKAYDINSRECMESQDKMQVLKFLKRTNLQFMSPFSNEQAEEKPKIKIK